MSSGRQPTPPSALSTLRAPPRLLWTGLALFSLLVLFYSVLIEGALLLGLVAISFVVFWVGAGWLLYAYAKQRAIGVVSWPITGTLVASVPILLYALLIEAAILLGVIAAGMFVAAGVVVGTLLTLGSRDAAVSDSQEGSATERTTEGERVVERERLADGDQR